MEMEKEKMEIIVFLCEKKLKIEFRFLQGKLIFPLWDKLT